MKKNILFFAIAAMLLSSVSGQISLDTYIPSSTISLIKLHNSGYKYKEYNATLNKIILYNLDNSIYKTISIPTQSIVPNKVGYISENLFDTDNDIEYFVMYQVISSPPTLSYVYIYNEDGTVLFYKDSVSIIQSYLNNVNVFENADIIYFDGQGVKMKLQLTNGTTAIYSLPGSIPCNPCVDNIISDFISKDHSLKEDMGLKIIPNPSSSEMKIYYQLPANESFGEIIIFNLQGMEMKRFNVGNSFEFITISTSDFVSGTYLCSIESNNRIIATKKMFVVK